jgi:hypothetical protein
MQFVHGSQQLHEDLLGPEHHDVLVGVLHVVVKGVHTPVHNQCDVHIARDPIVLLGPLLDPCGVRLDHRLLQLATEAERRGDLHDVVALDHTILNAIVSHGVAWLYGVVAWLHGVVAWSI